MAENRFKGNLPDYTPLDHSLQKRWQETASLQLGFSNATGKCHFRVWYNKEAPKDSDNRSLSAKIDMSPMTMNLILNCMRAMANGTYSGDTFNIGFKTMFAGQQRLETPKVISRVLVRRHAESGVIGITIIDGSKPPITFKMLPSERIIDMTDEDKQPIPLGEQSKFETLAWLDTVQGIITQLVALKTQQEKKREDGNNKGNHRKDYDDYDTSSSTDEDIPF